MVGFAHLGHQLILAGLQTLAHFFEILITAFRLREDSPRLFFFLDVVPDVLAENLHLRIVKFVARLHRLDLSDHLLGAVMLDVSFIEHVVFDIAPLFRVEDFFFDHRVDFERERDLTKESKFLSLVIQLFVLIEPFLNLPVIFFQQTYRQGIAAA